MTDLEHRLAERTLELCAIPSPIGEELAICDEVEAWAKGQRLPVRREHNSLIVEGAKPFALVGHLDTVPGHPQASRSRREGPRLYGRGASDMKGGLAVMQALLEDLPAAARPQAIFYEREEGPYAENGLEPLFSKGLLPKLQLAICLEPTDNRLELGCLGSLHATVRFRGKNAHSARPWEGENAIPKAADLLTRLATLPRKPVVCGGLTFYEVTEVTRAHGGQARNVIPDLFELNLNHRFAPGVTLEQAQAQVRALVGPSAELEFTDLSPSGPVCDTNPEVQRLIGQGLSTAAKQAWTDVARFAVHGIDAVNFGPGQPAQAHQVDEWCDIPSLGRAYESLRRWLTP